MTVYQLCSDTTALKRGLRFRKYLLITISLVLIANALYMNSWAIISSARQIIKIRPIFNIESSRLAMGGLLNPRLKSFVKPGDRILSVGENDWFNFYFLNPSPINVPLYWHNTVTFNQQLLDHDEYFSPDNIFNDVDVVYLSTAFNVEAVDIFYNNYVDFLSHNYLLIYSDAKIKIYRKVKASLK